MKAFDLAANFGTKNLFFFNTTAHLYYYIILYYSPCVKYFFIVSTHRHLLGMSKTFSSHDFPRFLNLLQQKAVFPPAEAAAAADTVTAAVLSYKNARYSDGVSRQK